MKFGVLTFSYKHFSVLEKSQAEKGFYSVNLGDNMQSLAVRSLYRQFGISDSDIIAVDRDSLSEYDGEPVVLPMNAVFNKWSFPLPPNVRPLFVGFHAREAVIRDNIDFFKRHAPIGCRDVDTASRFRQHGVAAFTTGCLTLTFPERQKPPSSKCVLIVYGAGHGALPAEVIRWMPEDALGVSEFVFQRKIEHRFPLSGSDMAAAENYAKHLLEDYRERASLVVTSLHHAAAPCIASGIPVVLCRRSDDTRFSYLRELITLHLPPDFSRIDWDVKPIDINRVRAALVDHVRAGLEAAINCKV